MVRGRWGHGGGRSGNKPSEAEKLVINVGSSADLIARTVAGVLVTVSLK
jgi:hypothetical protein